MRVIKWYRYYSTKSIPKSYSYQSYNMELSWYKPTTSCFLSSPPNLPASTPWCPYPFPTYGAAGTVEGNPPKKTLGSWLLSAIGWQALNGFARGGNWGQPGRTVANRGDGWLTWWLQTYGPLNWDCLGNVDRLCLRVSQSVGVCYLSWCYASCCLVFQVPFMLVEVVNHLTFKYTPKHEPHVTPFSGSTPAVNVVWNSRKHCWCWIAHDCSIFMLLKKRGVPLFLPIGFHINHQWLQWFRHPS